MRKYNHEQIKRDCAAGMKQADVAAKHGCSVSFVSHIATMSGYWRNQPSQLSDDHLKVVQMYCKGAPLKLIIAETGFNESHIYRVIRKVGVAPRRSSRDKFNQRNERERRKANSDDNIYVEQFTTGERFALELYE